MNPERWQQIDHVFAAALARPANQRAAWLEETCGEDHDLRREVEALLAAERAAGRFLSPPLDETRLSAARGPASWPEGGRRMGPYELLRPIGQGGMSTVYLATRVDGQYRREVAIKLIRRGFETAQVLHRFRTERQILAQLEHPSIARLYDGGTTEQGFPFLVMEYIEGLPLDRYCDHHRLSVAQRLALFREVCLAAHHAHRSLLVHRDLKPSNILVTREGQVKLLDFGIAKLLADQHPAAGSEDGARIGLTPTAFDTSTGVRPMTPGYASPEQIRGQAITTASDIYALGVLLYRLLIGRGPYRLDQATPEALERAILERVPEPPSVTLFAPVDASDSNDWRPSTAARARATTPRRLAAALRGDVDAITLRALAKRPEARYGSALALAEDLYHHRHHHPVAAMPSTLRYRTGRFLRRNAVAVVAGCLVGLMLVAGVSLGVLQAARVAQESRVAKQERAHAQVVSDFLLGLFGEADPNKTRGADITVREVLERSTETIDRLADQPQRQALYLFTIAGVYASLGQFDQAAELYQRALALQRPLYGEESLQVAATLNELAYIYQRQGRYRAAEKPMREAYEIRRRLLGEQSGEVLPSLNDLGLLLYYLGEYPEANRLLREAARRVEAGEGRDSEAAAVTKNNLALSLHETGHYEEAEALYLETLRVYRKLFGQEHVLVSTSLHNLASLLHDKGQLQEAERLFRQALAMRQKLLGKEHPRIVPTMTGLAETLYQQGRFAQSEATFRRAMALGSKVLGKDHWRVSAAASGLARLLLATGRAQEAEPMAREAATNLRAKLPAGHIRIAYAEAVLGGCLSQLGRIREAEPLLVASYPILRSRLSDREPMTRDARAMLAAHYARTGRADEAARYRPLAEPIVVEAQNGSLRTEGSVLKVQN